MKEQDEFPADEAETAGDKRSGTIQSVSIAARFLKILANAENELALGEVAKRAGTGGSTAHRYMQSLVKEGLAKQDPVSGFYDLDQLRSASESERSSGSMRWKSQRSI